MQNIWGNKLLLAYKAIKHIHWLNIAWMKAVSIPFLADLCMNTVGSHFTIWICFSHLYSVLPSTVQTNENVLSDKLRLKSWTVT